MPDIVSFSIPRSDPAVAELNANVEQLLEQRQLSPKVSFAVQLVIDELVTNIIKNDSGAHYDRDVAVRLHFEHDAVAVEIENQGEQFNPFEYPDPVLDESLEEKPVGGLGLLLTRKMMDECEYAYRDGNNHLLMRKRLSADEQPNGSNVAL